MTNTVSTSTPFLTELFKYGPIVLERPLSIVEFTDLHSQFPELLMEREANGKVTIMSPVKQGSGKREFIISGHLFLWHNEHQVGDCFSPSTGIELPTGAVKSPDVAWVSDERLATLDQDSDEQFLKVVPDFVVEVRSSTDRLKKLKSKMENTWMANGVRLAWLIDPYKETVWIYRADQEIEIVKGFEGKTLSGEEVLEGFELPLDRLRAK